MRLRVFSGVATQSKALVFSTCHHYDWVQIGGVIKHPDEGKIIDMNQAIQEETGVVDAKLTLYPVSGYGNPVLLQQVIDREKPDAILHFTDPRFWTWLYQMEHELRCKQNIPIFYYTIWDCPPIPHWNKPFYESCDLLMCISKQTHALVRGTLGENNYRTESNISDENNAPIVTYVPHGIDSDVFKPLNRDTIPVAEFKDRVFGVKTKSFVLLYNNRNIRRKMTADVILAYKAFCDTLEKSDAEKCALILKTAPLDENGTDLFAVKQYLCPDYDIFFIDQGLSDKEMNLLYNISDVTINLANNEGFGLGTAESLMSGVPIIVNVTGGLQDQCGFINQQTGKLLTVEDYTPDHPSNHNATHTSHGEWVKAIFPAVRNIMGSIPTPYIFDDRCRWEDAAIAIKELYDMDPSERQRIGIAGRDYVMSEQVGMSTEWLGNRMVQSMELAFKHKPNRKRFELFDTDEKKVEIKTGIIK